MRTMGWVCGLVGIAACCAQGVEMKEKYQIVKVESFSGQDENKVMSTTELKALQDEIRKETRLFSRALMQAQKEWKADATKARTSFPRAAVSPRRATVVGSTYTDMAEAQAKLTQMVQAEADRAKRDAEREKERQGKLPQNLRKKDAGKKDASQSERDARNMEAASLFTACLQRLMAEPEPGAAAQGAPEQKPE